MFSSVISASIYGIDAKIVSVETDVGNGLPSFDMSGYLGTEVKEARDRIKVAIKNTGIELIPQKIVINISPADIRKEGTGFDLPMAIGILVSNGYISEDFIKDTLLIGELSLDGRINPVNGILSCVCSARDKGLKRCIVPIDNLREGSIFDDIEVLGAKDLGSVIDYFKGVGDLLRYREDSYTTSDSIRSQEDAQEDFSDIKGQLIAKRATMIAVAGMHNIMYIGPPGSGKTMLAKRIPTIMPDMTREEMLTVTKIYSVAGELQHNTGLVQKRPFRSPHHSLTRSAMLGGGRIPKPGEVTLAGKGVLFLDEMTEFKTDILESLRQPLEDKEITIVRLNSACTYPADFMLAAAINPCKCGYYPDRSRCFCTEYDIRRYIGKISNPMWDRFDVCIMVDEVPFKELSVEGYQDTSGNCVTSRQMKELIENARQIQQHRFRGDFINFNSEMSSKDIKKYCRLGDKEYSLMEKMYHKLKLTARSYNKILKTARTIADIEGEENITEQHLSEAMFYRCSEIR
ncbi:MAG: YifB family Mg chelatase-like AAA ATPase [Eubacteriales bacterium]|nr:YifB family Mg chelatase-like AAA ATPase [Eubacteriales bacterium]